MYYRIKFELNFGWNFCIFKYIKYDYLKEIHGNKWYQYDEDFHKDIKNFLVEFLQ